jgi:hypothetical protein
LWHHAFHKATVLMLMLMLMLMLLVMVMVMVCDAKTHLPIIRFSLSFR